MRNSPLQIQDLMSKQDYINYLTHISLSNIDLINDFLSAFAFLIDRKESISKNDFLAKVLRHCDNPRVIVTGSAFLHSNITSVNKDHRGNLYTTGQK